MIAMIHLATLLITTIFAAAIALALDWVLLRAAFALMQPATVRRSAPRTDLARGTARLARVFAAQR